MGARRLDWVDQAKGLGILLVVYGHVQRGVVNAGIGDGPLLDWLDYGIYTFHMPLFFLLSGLFVGRSLSRGTGPFLTGRLLYLVYPYFLWSVIQGGLQIALSGSINGSRGWEDLLRIPWEPLGQFWFLQALFWGQIVILLLHRSPLALVGSALLALAVQSLLPGVLGQVAYALPPLVAGMVLADRGVFQRLAEDDWRTTRLLSIPILAALFLVAVWWGGGASAMNNFAWPSYPATLLGIAVVIAACMCLGGPALAPLRLLGQASMSIYILHIIAGSGIRVVLLKLGFTEALVLHLVAGTLVGILAPLAAHGILDRFGLVTWAGLGAGSRR